MIKFLLSASLITSLALQAASWKHEGENGPHAWGDLHPAYSTCKEGNTQSPINILSKQAKQGAIHFDIEIAKTQNAKLENNGHTLEIQPDGKNTLEFKGQVYTLLQLHFHTPSEHAINGEITPLEAHYVFTNKDKKLLVVGILFKEGKSNALLEQMVKNMASKKGDITNINDVALASLLPNKLNSYQFDGSLTTPPCHQEVQWVVLKEIVDAGKSQIDELAKIMGNNSRPLQKLNGREIKGN